MLEHPPGGDTDALALFLRVVTFSDFTRNHVLNTYGSKINYKMYLALPLFFHPCWSELEHLRGNCRVM